MTPSFPPRTAEVLRHASLTCAAPHPTRPWLATGSMSAGDGDSPGQTVVWDLDAGEAIGVSGYEHGFGFEPRPRMLQWSPDGGRLAIAAGTNEIAVVEPGREPVLFAPDETRDHPVEFCWVDDHTLFAAAWSDDEKTKGGGALLSLAENEARWLTRAAVPVVLTQPVRARDASAVVGHDYREVFVIDTKGDKLISRTPLPQTFANGRSVAGWSPHGKIGVFAPPPIEQRYDRSTGRDTGGRTELVLFQPASPQALVPLEVAGEVGAIRFGPDGRRFIVVSRTVWGGVTHATVFDGASKLGVFDAQLVRPPHHFPDAGNLVWSPDGEHLALLRADGAIEITTPRGERRAAFAAPKSPGEVGLMFVNKDRVALIGQDGMTVFDRRGTVVMRFQVEG